LYAQRDIAANEELFFDYNYTNESHQLHSPTVVAGKAVVKEGSGKNAKKLLPVSADTRR
jgi:SET domain-containing protein